MCLSSLLKHLLLLRLYYWRIAFWQIDFTSLHYVLPFLLDRKFDLHWTFDRGSWVDRWINSTLLLRYVNSYIILGHYLYVFVWSWKILSKSISLFDFFRISKLVGTFLPNNRLKKNIKGNGNLANTAYISFLPTYLWPKFEHLMSSSDLADWTFFLLIVSDIVQETVN